MSGEIKIAAMNPDPSVSGKEFAIDRVISKSPAARIGLAADASQRFQKFEQADVFAAATLQNWKGVERDRRVNGNALLVCRGRRGRRGQEGDSGQQDGRDLFRQRLTRQRLVRCEGGHFNSTLYGSSN